MSRHTARLTVLELGAGCQGVQPALEFEAGTGITYTFTDIPTLHKLRVRIDSAGGGGGGPWPASGYTGAGGSPGVAAFNAAGAAQEVQAAVEETMLVRRGGMLQWIPLLVMVTVYQPTLGFLNDEAIEVPGEPTVWVGGSFV